MSSHVVSFFLATDGFLNGTSAIDFVERLCSQHTDCNGGKIGYEGDRRWDFGYQGREAGDYVCEQVDDGVDGGLELDGEESRHADVPHVERHRHTHTT